MVTVGTAAAVPSTTPFKSSMIAVFEALKGGTEGRHFRADLPAELKHLAQEKCPRASSSLLSSAAAGAFEPLLSISVVLGMRFEVLARVDCVPLQLNVGQQPADQSAGHMSNMARKIVVARAAA